MWDVKRCLDAKGIQVEYAKRSTTGAFIIQLCPDQDPKPLLKIKSWAGVKVTVTMPDSMNQVRGIIHHPELRYMISEEVLEMTEEFGVVKVFKPPTANYAILAWDRADGPVPETVLVAWDRVRVKPCLPRPRRCYCCHTYGHTAAVCTKRPVCSRCGQEHEEELEACNNELHCAACGGKHAATDPDCPKWKEEKAVIKIRQEKKISYSEALKQQRKKQDKQDQKQKNEEAEAQEQKNEEQPKKTQEKEEEENQQKRDKKEDYNQDQEDTEDSEETSDEEIEVEEEKTTEVAEPPKKKLMYEKEETQVPEIKSMYERSEEAKLRTDLPIVNQDDYPHWKFFRWGWFMWTRTDEPECVGRLITPP